MNFTKDFVAPIGVLTAICLIISSILVFVQGLTEPLIEKQKIETANKARAEVLAEADNFEMLEIELPAGVVEAYKATNGAGYVITTKSKGYGGDLVVMVGIKADGTISKVKNLENNETPGLGSKVKEEAYTSQYQSANSTLEGVEAIAGSTISSNAFTRTVKQAFEIYKEVAGVEAEASQREPVSQDVLKEVSPKATGFVKIENAEEIYEATGEGFVYVGEAEGFMDKIVAAIAMDKDGAITAIKFVEINESADYGMDLTKESYLAKYIGKKSGDTLDSVSGATVSSDAFNKIVSKALETVETVKGAK